jgi:5-methylcytosine-specific restriction endonuclease McrA
MSALPDFAPLRRAGANPALVLNADFRPLSLFPLSIWRWEDAVSAMFKGTVEVVAQHDAVARSPSTVVTLPSVVALKRHVNVRRTPAFTRANVLLRDRHCCAYCGQKFPTHELTWDHVIPRSRGGKTSWQNIVLACAPCNVRKDDRTPDEAGMRLLWRPWKPTPEELHRAGRRFPLEHLHKGWRDFLYWDGEIEE